MDLDIMNLEDAIDNLIKESNKNRFDYIYASAGFVILIALLLFSFQLLP